MCLGLRRWALSGVYDGVPSLMVWGSSFVTGSFLAMAHAVFVAAITPTFKRGYVKPSSRQRGARTLALSLVAWCVLSAFAATLMGVVVTELGTRLAGCAPALPSLADFAQWVMQVTLCVSAYSALTVLAVLLPRQGPVWRSRYCSALAVLKISCVCCLPTYRALRRCSVTVLMGILRWIWACWARRVSDPLSYVQSIGTIAVARRCASWWRKRSFA
ncbi:MAG: hypothetical protein ACLTQI_06015 [Slackia sp.]